MWLTDILRRFSSYPDDDNQFDENYYDQTKMRKLLDAEVPLPADVDWFRSHFLRCEAVGGASSFSAGGKCGI